MRHRRRGVLGRLDDARCCPTRSPGRSSRSPSSAGSSTARSPRRRPPGRTRCRCGARSPSGTPRPCRPRVVGEEPEVPHRAGDVVLGLRERLAHVRGVDVASSSACSSMRSASRVDRLGRSSRPIRGHGPSSNALRALATARSASSSAALGDLCPDLAGLGVVRRRSARRRPTRPLVVDDVPEELQVGHAVHCLSAEVGCGAAAVPRALGEGDVAGGEVRRRAPRGGSTRTLSLGATAGVDDGVW